MSYIDDIKQLIISTIRANNNQEITGQKMYEVLSAMLEATNTTYTLIDSIQIAGVALLQSLGSSETMGISQKVISEYITALQTAANSLRQDVDKKIDDIRVGGESKVEIDPDTGEKYVNFRKDQFGKIDGVKLNGEELEVDENGKVNIPIPTTVHDLDPEDEYATKEDAQAMVDEAKVTGATLNYQEDGGSPSASLNFSGGSLDFTLKNMKMKFSDLTPEERALLKGEQGRPGADRQPVEEGDVIIAHTTGQDEGKVMSQKAVTDALLSVVDSISDPSTFTADNNCRIGGNVGSEVWKPNDATREVGKLFALSEFPYGFVRITPQEGYKIIYAFTQNGYTNSASVSYATDGQKAVSAEEVTIKIPSNANYMWFGSFESSDANVKNPLSITFLDTLKEDLAAFKEDVSGMVGDIDDNIQAISGAQDSLREDLQVDLDGKTLGTLISGAFPINRETGGYIASSSDKTWKHYLIPNRDYTVVKYKSIGTSSGTSVVTLYSDLEISTSNFLASPAYGTGSKEGTFDLGDYTGVAMIVLSEQAANDSEAYIKIPQPLKQRCEELKEEVASVGASVPNVKEIASYDAESVVGSMVFTASNTRIRTSSNNGVLNVLHDDVVRLKLNENYISGWKIAVKFFNSNLSQSLDTGWKLGDLSYTVPSWATRMDIVMAKANLTTVITAEEKSALEEGFEIFHVPYLTTSESLDVPSLAMMKEEISKAKGGASSRPMLRSIRSVAHRGFGGNNLLPSYEQTSAAGFDWAETDVRFTSDGVCVCSHDDSFVSGGNTIVISQHTLEELLEYDYFGGTLATLDDVMKSCKKQGLGLMLDKIDYLAPNNQVNEVFESRLANIMAIISKYGMWDNVEWLLSDRDTNGAIVPRIMSYYPKFRLARNVSLNNVAFVNWADKQGVITQISGWMTNYPQAICTIDLNYTGETAATLTQVRGLLPAGCQIGLWTINNVTEARALHPYANAITSDEINEYDIREM